MIQLNNDSWFSNNNKTIKIMKNWKNDLTICKINQSRVERFRMHIYSIYVSLYISMYINKLLMTRIRTEVLLYINLTSPFLLSWYHSIHWNTLFVISLGIILLNQISINLLSGYQSVLEILENMFNYFFLPYSGNTDFNSKSLDIWLEL